MDIGKLKNFRRKILEHSEDCQMGKYGIYHQCSCHYTDCLNFNPDKKCLAARGTRDCICDIINANIAHRKETTRRNELPWYKRILLRRIYIYEFLK